MKESDCLPSTSWGLGFELFRKRKKESDGRTGQLTTPKPPSLSVGLF